MILSINTEKAFDKMQNLFTIKIPFVYMHNLWKKLRIDYIDKNL